MARVSRGAHGRCLVRSGAARGHRSLGLAVRSHGIPSTRASHESGSAHPWAHGLARAAGCHDAPRDVGVFPGRPMSRALAGRTALITGGTRGLGLEIARAYLEAGAQGVCVGGRDAAALKAAAAELNELADPEQRVLGVLADVSSSADVERLMDSALACLGELTILVSNAGVYGPKGRIDRTDWSEWVRAVE